MEMDDQILWEAERNVRHFWRVALTLGLPAVVAFLGALLALSFGHPLTPPIASVMIGAVLCYGIMLWLAWPHFPGKTVLWVRRFHQGERSKRLQVLLEFAAAGSGDFITLADDDVESESGRRVQASGPYAALIGGGVMLFLLIKGNSLWMLGSVAGILWYGMERLPSMFRKGHRRTPAKMLLTPANMERKLKKSMRAMRWRRAAQTVFRAPTDGELWFETIRFLADHVDAAVVFAEECSPGVDREIDALLNAGRLGGRNFVLLYAGPSPARLVSAHPALAEAWSLQLPPKLNPWWPYNRTGRELSYLIQAAVISPRASGGAERKTEVHRAAR